MSDMTTWLAIVGLGVVSVLTRGFFFLSEQGWRLPRWAEQGLRYAPIAAVSAVVLPEVLSTQGVWLQSWQDARLLGALAGLGWAFWRGGVLGTIVAGMAVFLPLRIGLGW
ncbi:MAG TPA: AzlD domain-containing protein [Macromonas sp.]|nr:AzlD domain-containing protein [Macromonas sp.]